MSIDKYYTYTRSGGVASGIIKDTMVIIGANKTFQASPAWIVKTTQTSANLGLTDYDLELVDLSDNVVARASSTYNNVEVLRYKATVACSIEFESVFVGLYIYGDTICNIKTPVPNIRNGS